MPVEDAVSVSNLVDRLLDRAERVVVGQRDNLELMLLALLCGGHILLEGVPGTAKTLMARTLARMLRMLGLLVQFLRVHLVAPGSLFHTAAPFNGVAETAIGVAASHVPVRHRT